MRNPFKRMYKSLNEEEYINSNLLNFLEEVEKYTLEENKIQRGMDGYDIEEEDGDGGDGESVDADPPLFRKPNKPDEMKWKTAKYKEEDDGEGEIEGELEEASGPDDMIDDFAFGSLDDALEDLPQAPSTVKEERGLSVLDAFLEELEQVDEVDAAAIRDVDYKVIDDPVGLKTKQKDLANAEQTQRLLHNSTVKGLVDESGNTWNLNKLIHILTQKPTEMLKQNAKIQKSGSDNKVFYNYGLPAYHGLWYDEADKIFKLVRTCPSADKCKRFCYAIKGGYIMFPAPSVKAGSILNYLLNHPEEFKDQLVNEIKSETSKLSKKDMQMVLRWHDSGDFFNDAYTDLVLEVARETPDVLHYAYTKQVSELKNKDLPDNFVINFSKGGTQDVDIGGDKQADVVPAGLFNNKTKQDKKDFPEYAGSKLNLDDPKDVEELKDRVSKHLGIERETLISYPEMMKMIDSEDEKFLGKKNYWNVLVWAGHGDDAATRPEVKNTLLLIH